ncbi:MAG TPA: amidohydrolase family protein [Verrucomicrobiae bacterium]|jgi:cytosine/adenosine deaminase-related metal-dependent hydrolase|nr:amidohydrolase family protein [Verrucomicrobiae bacterium]
MSSPRRLLRARVVVPISAPPLDDGAVLLDGNRIAAVGPYRDFSGEPALDLGPCVLLPGLVNAHCHLDYTDMTGLPAPRHFPDWIKSLLVLKSAASYTDYAAAWLRGADMLLQTGTTTVGDIEAVPELVPEVWSSTPLRVLSFFEMTGVKSRRDPTEILRETARRIDSLPPGRSSGGLSPHALYSTSPALLQAAGEIAAARRWPLTMHLAESIDEWSMYRERSGVLFDWLRPQRDMSDCDGATPVEKAAHYGLLRKNFLAVHANYLTPGDVALLAEAGASVAHCPRSHAYFGHQPFSYRELANRGVNVCLGTDSLASVTKAGAAPLELSLFAEMRQFAGANPDVAPEEILRLATTHAARALGMAEQVGEISPGAAADLIALPLPSANARDVCAAVVHDAAHVVAAMIDGQWAIAPNN